MRLGYAMRETPLPSGVSKETVQKVVTYLEDDVNGKYVTEMLIQRCKMVKANRANRLRKGLLVTR